MSFYIFNLAWLNCYKKYVRAYIFLWIFISIYVILFIELYINETIQNCGYILEAIILSERRIQ